MKGIKEEMMVLRTRCAWLALLGMAVGCGGSAASSSTPGDFAGLYDATYSGTYVVTSPPGQPGGSSTDTATIAVSDLSKDQIRATFQLPPNPPSGVIDFALMGDMGAFVGSATDGMCFSGIVNGNTQINCCTQCSISFAGNTFVQPNQGTFTGTTAAGVPYSGTYSGMWTGTKR
jgi:hypothetical protein